MHIFCQSRFCTENYCKFNLRSGWDLNLRCHGHQSMYVLHNKGSHNQATKDVLHRGCEDRILVLLSLESSKIPPF